MCRLMGYLGPAIPLARLLDQPDHSLVVQSYQPREMTAGLLNADGFGLGWYDGDRPAELPFTYKNTQPIWNDINLPHLGRYVETGCVLANVRSATPGQAVDLSNCQPFQHGLILGVHNGFIENFRQTLYRPLRDRLSDLAYQTIHGSTDSEHIFALMVDVIEQSPEISLTEVLVTVINTLEELASSMTSFSANLILSDGKQLVASRYANRQNPTLYWLKDSPLLPNAVLIASEPLFPGDWTACPERSILTVTYDLDIQIRAL
jgi:ergothioneine biosynthesis protein EgtC